MKSGTLHVTDPTFTPRDRYNVIDRLALRLIKDERDLPFLHLIGLLTAIVMLPGLAWFLFALPIWLAPLYWALVLGVYLGPYILMLHNTSHRKLFRTEYKWLGGYIPWVLGPFFGETPNTYYVHHIGMHHPENNLEDDLSCTMPYQRDSIIDFLRYFGRFMFIGWPELLNYMWVRRRFKLFRQALIGEAIFYAAMVLLLWLNPIATLIVFIIPFIFARFGMMAGNWAQHAFIDRNDPANPYRNSITCINCTYNRRCFNDGYHIGHHVKANRHWTEMPTDFVDTMDEYARQGAIVFEGVDFFGVWFLLMTHQYNALAKRYVPLDDTAPTKEEIIGLLKERTRKIVRRQPQMTALN